MMLLEGIREAFLQIKAYRYIAFTAIGIMSFILLVFGIFLLSFYNITIFAETLKSDMQVIAYLDNSVPHERVADIKNEIEDFREVDAVNFISRDYALEMLSKNILSVREIVKELDGNPLPDSFRISLVSDARNPEGIKTLAARLKGVREIEDVEYGKEWVERLDILISTAKVIGAVIGGIIILLVLFTVYSTVKFTLITRRDEIEIMKYAGATNIFIKIPFLIEGGVLCLISALSSIVMLFLAYKLILYKIPPAAYLWLGGMEFTFIPWEAIALIIGLSVIIGCFGSWVSVGKYLGVAIFLFLCLNVYNVADAKSGNPQVVDIQSVDKEIKKSQKELEDINKKISEKKKASKQAAIEEKKVNKNINVKQKDLIDKKSDLKKTDRRIIEKERELNSTQVEIDIITTELTDKKREMAEFLKYTYKSQIGRNKGLSGVLFASADYNEFIVSAKFEDILINEANRMLKDLDKEVDSLNGQLLGINKRHHTLMAEKDKLLKDKTLIERDVRQSRVKLAGIQERKAIYEGELRRLAGASAELKSLIEIYEKKRSDLASISTGFGKERGRLNWPLAGEVVSGFGKQKHPEFDAYVFKKGIEIVSNSGKDVKAVYDGVVAYADSLKGYGLITIIDHGDSYYSVYGHLSRLVALKGKKIKRGDIIAAAGSGNGNLTDKEGLYFEIRHNGQAIDPLAWLKAGNR